MAGEHTRRDKPTFYNFLALERRPLDSDGPLAGVAGALMSEELSTGSKTFVVELPPGWSTATDGCAGSLEFVLLRGDIQLEAARVGAGSYLHVPQGCGGGELRSDQGGVGIAFWNPDAPTFPAPFTENRTVSLRDLDWQLSIPDSHGFMHKSLRLPDPTGSGFDGGPGGYLRLVYIAPGVDAPFQHLHHECFEECICLGGDVLFCDEGLSALGSVVGHPQECWHGPLATRGGTILLVHTDAPMGFPWPPRDYPFQQEICNAYLDEAPWDEHAAHTPWDETPWRRFQESEAFIAWATSPGGAAYWRDPGAAARFRAEWTRKPGAGSGN